VLRAIPLRHPSLLQAHVVLPVDRLRPTIHEIAERPQRGVKSAAVTVKTTSRPQRCALATIGRRCGERDTTRLTPRLRGRRRS
jgi:hypothetical protein